MSAAILEIEDFSVTYGHGRNAVPAVRGVALEIDRGEIVGLVGESGSGKSTLVSAMLGLLPHGTSVRGALRFEGRDIYALEEVERRRLRGTAIATVSQDPFTALNPVVPIGRQLIEFQHWLKIGAKEKQERALEMLVRVGLSDPKVRMGQYPYQLSGGIRQRVAIAAALLVTPRLLVADEPTTALDATTEAQIVDLIRDVRSLVEGSIVFVTHDMGLVGELCDRIAVMYAGELIEIGPVSEVFAAPQHPYTRALLECDPSRISEPARQLPTIAGIVPSPRERAEGCIFAPRCPLAADLCHVERPALLSHRPHSRVACHRVAA